MNGHFLKISGFHGELKRSTKRNNLGISVSTEEVVFQLPHVNYHILLKDIVSIIPYRFEPKDALRVVHQGQANHEVIRQRTQGLPVYKIYALKVMAHNRSGKHMMGPLDLMMPISKDMLGDMMKYGELNRVH